MVTPVSTMESSAMGMVSVLTESVSAWKELVQTPLIATLLSNAYQSARL
jgi:hypothetical protein